MTATAFSTPDAATAAVGELLTGAAALQSTPFWKMLPDDLLALGRDLEQLSRLVYAAQIHLTGEIDTAGLAALKSCSSTPALLRQAYNISPAEATGRVKAARQILPRETMTGPEAPPLLPVLGAAVQAGRLDPEHIRTVIDTMGKIPTDASVELRDACEQALVGVAVDADPKFLERAATVILEHADPDGTLDQDPPTTRMGLDIGPRNIRTGLTPIKGHLDDLGIEAVRKAIDALAAPHPAADGTPDARSPANRRAHALVQAMLGYLAAGNGPTSGGQRPQVTVILDWDAIKGLITDARFDTGGYLSPAQARQLLRDAVIIPAVLGTDSEILDVGRSSRTFPPAIRRALALRDRGCAWPGCDRPPGWCDAHHIAFWSRDLGPTSLDDGVLFCPYHHTEIHREQWRVSPTPADGRNSSHPAGSTPNRNLEQTHCTTSPSSHCDGAVVPLAADYALRLRIPRPGPGRADGRSTRADEERSQPVCMPAPPEFAKLAGCAMMHVMQETIRPVGLRASKKEATSRALSSAARSLALEHGLDDVTIDMICASAGVSTRTFFNYFESKGDAMVGERMPLGDERSRETFVAGGPSGELLADIMTLVDPSSILVSERRDDLRTALALVKAEPRVLALHLTRGAEMELELAGLIAARQGLAEPDFLCATTAALAQTVLRCALFEWFNADAEGAPGPYLRQATTALLTLARPSPDG